MFKNITKDGKLLCYYHCDCGYRYCAYRWDYPCPKCGAIKPLSSVFEDGQAAKEIKNGELLVLKEV